MGGQISSLLHSSNDQLDIWKVTIRCPACLELSHYLVHFLLLLIEIHLHQTKQFDLLLQNMCICFVAFSQIVDQFAQFVAQSYAASLASFS